MTWIPCLIPCFLLFWPIVKSPFLLLVVSCVRDMATVNLFLWRPKQKVYIQLHSFAVYAVVMRHLVTLPLQKRCQTNLFSPFSKQNARMASFLFHANYPEPALIDQVKTVKPSQTKSKHLISSTSQSQKRNKLHCFWMYGSCLVWKMNEDFWKKN